MIKTVGDLIAALKSFPADTPIGTTSTDSVGEKFYSGVTVDNDYANEYDRFDGDGREVVVIR